MVRVCGDEPRDQHAVHADELLDRQFGSLRLGHCLNESFHRLVGGHGQPLGLHLAQLGKALVPEVGVPCVVIAVRSETHLDVELGHGGNPATQRLEQLHFGPLVIANATSGFGHVETARQITPVPRCERSASGAVWITNHLARVDGSACSPRQ